MITQNYRVTNCEVTTVLVLPAILMKLVLRIIYYTIVELFVFNNFHLSIVMINFEFCGADSCKVLLKKKLF